MDKLDLSKRYKSYFSARTTPALVEIENAQYISIVGKGDPSCELFARKIEALYSTAYNIKFRCKDNGRDFVVPKLEGLWWYDEKKFKNISMTGSPGEVPRKEWEYRLLIRMPDFVEAAEIKKAVNEVSTQKNTGLVGEVTVFEMAEGRCVQMLHVGPFAKETETLAVMAAFISEHKLLRNGLHHEIYLSDFRKTKADRLKTILREPVK